MTKQLVVDASVMVKCLLPEDDSSYALELYADNNYELIAPDFLLLEITNAVWKRLKLGQIEQEDAEFILSEFYKDTAIKFFPSIKYIERAFTITKTIGHNSVYDCIYSALSEEQNCPLITADLAYISKINKANINQKIITLNQITTH